MTYYQVYQDNRGREVYQVCKLIDDVKDNGEIVYFEVSIPGNPDRHTLGTLANLVKRKFPLQDEAMNRIRTVPEDDFVPHPAFIDYARWETPSQRIS
jgi:hypothetical protein